MKNFYILLVLFFTVFCLINCETEPDPEDVISYTLNNEYFEYTKGFSETNNLPIAIWRSNEDYMMLMALNQSIGLLENPEFGVKITFPGTTSGNKQGYFYHITTESDETATYTSVIDINITIDVEVIGNIGGYVKGTFSGSSDNDEVVNGYFNVMRFSEDVLP